MVAAVRRARTADRWDWLVAPVGAGREGIEVGRQARTRTGTGRTTGVVTASGVAWRMTSDWRGVGFTELGRASAELSWCGEEGCSTSWTGAGARRSSQPSEGGSSS